MGNAKTTQRTVLIVDDDPAIRDAVKLALNEQDLLSLDIHEATNVERGLVKAYELQPDLVILDLHMPGKSGFEFMDELRGGKLRGTPVLMLTANDDMETIFTAGEKGIDMFHVLGKPFNVDDLQAMVYKLTMTANSAAKDS